MLECSRECSLCAPDACCVRSGRGAGAAPEGESVRASHARCANVQGCAFPSGKRMFGRPPAWQLQRVVKRPWTERDPSKADSDSHRSTMLRLPDTIDGLRLDGSVVGNLKSGKGCSGVALYFF